MKAVDTIWLNIERLIIERNSYYMTQEQLTAALALIYSDAKFVCSLKPEPQKFVCSISGQVLGFEIFFDPLLCIWKATLRDALGNAILSDISLLAGVNNIKGMHARYRAYNASGQIVEENLAIEGFFITEPLDMRYNRFEFGPERSPWAFTNDSVGNCTCAFLFFSDKQTSNLYEKLINGENGEEFIDIESVGYDTVVK